MFALNRESRYTIGQFAENFKNNVTIEKILNVYQETLVEKKLPYFSSEVPSLKIAGRSGCRIEITEEDEKLLVTKYASSINYNERLERQAKKQQEFSQLFGTMRWFKAPEIFSEEELPGQLRNFKMEYASGVKSTTYLAEADISAVKGLAQKFIYFFKSLEQVSTLSPAPTVSINIKNESLFEALEKSGRLPQSLTARLCDHMHKEVPIKSLPLGYCHGDFTLSNMLFSIWHIYIFDFLDSFIESPLIDIIKLRQDTRFGWTLLLDEDIPKHHTNRVRVVLDYLDKQITDYASTNASYRVWHNYLEIYNLARIVPYVQVEKEIQFLEKNLKSLLN